MEKFRAGNFWPENFLLLEIFGFENVLSRIFLQLEPGSLFTGQVSLPERDNKA